MTDHRLQAEKLFSQDTEFLNYVREWWGSLLPVSLVDLTNHGRDPGKLAIMSIDLIKGFAVEGPLASPKIAAIVPSVVELFESAYAMGVREFLLFEDSHPKDSPEFEAFGPHCAAGSVEAETVDEIMALPFSDEFVTFPKESLSPAIGTGFDEWMDQKPEIASVIVVGDCTDLCVYQLAMHLRMRANATRRDLEVIVPEDCVQTYQLSVADAEAIRAMPHDGGLLHPLFLYHMALNGVRVAERVV